MSMDATKLTEEQQFIILGLNEVGCQSRKVAALSESCRRMGHNVEILYRHEFDQVFE